MSIIELPDEPGLMPSDSKRLPNPSDWTFELIETYFDAIRRTAERFGLDTYPSQLEVISC